MNIKSIKEKNNIKLVSIHNREISKQTSSNSINLKSFSPEYSQGLKNYALSKISFNGTTTEKPRALSSVRELGPRELKYIVNTIIRSGKKPVIFSDYDGTFAGFVESANMASPFGKAPTFSNMLNKLEDKGIPFFILTSRTVKSLEKENTLGPVINENGAFNSLLNIIGLKGNDFKLSEKLDKNIYNFIKEKKEKTNGEILINECNEHSYISLSPNVDEKINTEFINELNRKLSIFRFKTENKKLLINLHWRKAEDDFLKNVPDELYIEHNLYSEIYNWRQENSELYKNVPSEAKTLTLKVKNGDYLETKISFEELLGFAKHVFEDLAQKYFGDELKNNIKKLHLDTGAKVYEIGQTNIANKGESLEEIVNLLGGKEKIFPIFIGDAIGKGQDDEYAIMAANKLGGFGIAVKKRSKDEMIENPYDDKTDLYSHLSKKTNAKYKLDSYEITHEFINALSEQL